MCIYYFDNIKIYFKTKTLIKKKKKKPLDVALVSEDGVMGLSTLLDEHNFCS